MCAPSDIFLGLLAVLFPPLAVWIKSGICSCESLLNILLTILGFLPGLLHAWYIIASTPDQGAAMYYYEPIDVEAGHGASRIPGPAGAQSHGYAAPPPQLGPRAPAPTPAGYGTINSALVGAAGPSNGDQIVANAPYQDLNQDAQPPVAPPSYAQAVKGDNKVQK